MSTLMLGPRAAATLATFTSRDASGLAFQTMNIVQSPVFSVAVTPLASLATLTMERLTLASASESPQLTQLSATALQLKMPPLLTLPGTRPPELGMPLLFTPPRRTPWRAVSAGSVVLGLVVVVAILLGLRLVRAKAMTSGAAGVARRAAAPPAAPRSALPVQVAYAATADPYYELVQSLMSAQESVAQPQLPAPPGLGSSAPPR